MDTVLEIIELSYDGQDLLPRLTDLNGNGILDLDDLEHTNAEGDEDDLVGLFPVPGTESTNPRLFVMAVRLHLDLATNEHMNDGGSLITFALNTDPSQ